MSYNPLKGIDYSSLHNYSITNVPIMTYALMGITTFALGYITLKDKQNEKSSSPDEMKGGQLNNLDHKKSKSKSKTKKNI